MMKKQINASKNTEKGINNRRRKTEDIMQGVGLIDTLHRTLKPE